LSRQSIHAIENEKFEPKVGNAIKIARFFGLRVDELFND
jgi:DNA-binding XRE family transcriptional regulator